MPSLCQAFPSLLSVPRLDTEPWFCFPVRNRSCLKWKKCAPVRIWNTQRAVRRGQCGHDGVWPTGTCQGHQLWREADSLCPCTCGVQSLKPCASPSQPGRRLSKGHPIPLSLPGMVTHSTFWQRPGRRARSLWYFPDQAAVQTLNKRPTLGTPGTPFLREERYTQNTAGM